MGSHLSAGELALLEGELQLRCRKLEEQLAAHLHGQSAAEHAREVLLQDGDDAPQRLPERDIAAALTDYERSALLQSRAALDRMARLAALALLWQTRVRLGLSETSVR